MTLRTASALTNDVDTIAATKADDYWPTDVPQHPTHPICEQSVLQSPRVKTQHPWIEMVMMEMRLPKKVPTNWQGTGGNLARC